jgi:MFS family permease
VNRWLESTFASLQIREFRILWVGTILSFVAFFMSMIVQSVVAFEIAGTNTAVGYVVFAQGAAMALFGPLGGAFADRWPKRRVVVVCQLGTALVLTTIGGLLAADRLQIEMLAAAAFAMGSAFAFLGPARQSLVVDLVPERRRGNAMAVTLIANTGSRVLGPMVAGVLLGWPLAGAMGAYFAMAFFYAASTISMSWLPKSIVRPKGSQGSVISSVIGGFGYVWQRSQLRLLLIFYIAVILIGFPHVAVLPGLIENVYQEDAASVSRLFTASALGAVIASIWVAQFADSHRALLIYAILGAVFGSGLIALAIAPGLWSGSLAMFFVGVGSGGFQALNAAVIARETAPEFMGRVMSLTMLAFAGFGLMALPIGAAADAIGEPATLFAMGSVVVLVSLVMGRALARQSVEPFPLAVDSEDVERAANLAKEEAVSE